jgi:hypothetical protein
MGMQENTYLTLCVCGEQPTKDGNERRICLYGNEVMLASSKQTDHHYTTL